ncbi:hypothetical protein CROQUDRAFT_341615 [Cronartium quercuum f. sp. fusiforme G11]|uniref:Large ribosomal subunit protein uL23m n=1 Tax=Cronartium quercuum f. sp. fusiforme G11 TaxID=708437 RepID=A0A9P6NPH9_9BASI|nr:hypothetical protein CROQUDRAFT_341615 [Cronartium quercuum f. sp. fusiforme G11]
MSPSTHFLRQGTTRFVSLIKLNTNALHKSSFHQRSLVTPASDAALDSCSPNQPLRQALAKLPVRPPRLDGCDPPPGIHKTDRALLRSLAGGRSPVGASYVRARSPVFFPNVPLQLVRPSATDRSDPFTAIFRCDLRLTKPDIYNYLRQIYGLGITSIRTAIYRGRYVRKLRSRLQGGLTRERDGDRTFKKVWVGMDRPFFFPSGRSERWLEEQYMYSDSLNTYRRSKAESVRAAETDRRAVLPRGMEGKGERRNVLREVMEESKMKEEDLKRSVRKSLAGSSSLSELEPEKQ